MLEQKQFFLLVVLVSISGACHSDGGSWLYPDSVAGYVGAGTEYKLKQALAFRYDSSHETMYAIEADWELDPDSVFNRAAGWIGATIEPVFLLAHRDDRQQDIGITEGALFASLRWSNFPWNDALPTAMAIGWGVSYTDGLTANEAQDAQDTDEDEGPQRWLNYLSVEYAFGLPQYPRWQVFYRLHHRSGAFGLFAANDVGSNVMGLGLRYRFP